MKLLVTGGRDFADKAMVDSALTRLHAIKPIELLIEGGAKGADRMCRLWAEEQGIPVLTVEANWELYGRRAGPIRNEEMLLHAPDRLLAFPGGRGTKDMVTRAATSGIPVTRAEMLVKT